MTVAAPYNVVEVVPKKTAPALVTAADLQGKHFSPVRWVLPDLIPEGLTILASKPKLGKSWLMLATSLATAAGGFILDRHCIEGDVLYAALEDGERRLKERLGKVCPSPDWPARLTFCTEMPNLAEGGLEFLQAWISAAPDPRLIIIDTFAKVRPTTSRQETQYEADYRAAGLLKTLADRSGVAVLIVHHVRKMEAEDPFDMVSGTNGLTGAADTIIVLKRDAGGVTLYARGRDIEEQELALEFQKDVCRWRLLGLADEVHRSDERKLVVDALRGAGEPLTVRAISDLTEHPYAATRKLIFRMGQDGLLTRIGRGRYQLAEAA